jgi:hypothetical protein
MSPIESVVNDVFPVTYEVRTLVFTSKWIDVVARCRGSEVTDTRERQLLACEGVRLMNSRLRRGRRQRRGAER